MYYNNLADLYLSQNRLDEAEDYARRTLAIMETLDLSAQPWKTYNILAELAEKRGRMDEVREWRRKEQESFAAFAGSDTKIKEWLPVIAAIVAACQGNEEAKNQLEPFLEQQGQTDDWRNLIAVIRRIMNGERDGNIVEGLDGTDSLIVTRILQALNGESSPLRPAERDTSPKSSEDLEEDKSEGGVTLPQLLECRCDAFDLDWRIDIHGGIEDDFARLNFLFVRQHRPPARREDVLTVAQ